MSILSHTSNTPDAVTPIVGSSFLASVLSLFLCAKYLGRSNVPKTTI